MTDLSDSTKDLIRRAEQWLHDQGDELIVYGEGLCYASVCTSLDDEELDARMAARPATLDHGWMRSKDTHFQGGQTNPCPCDQKPTHRHVLFQA